MEHIAWGFACILTAGLFYRIGYDRGFQFGMTLFKQAQDEKWKEAYKDQPRLYNLLK